MLKTAIRTGVLCCLFLAPGIGVSQEIVIRETPEVARLMDSWQLANRSAAGKPGWRVQIIAATDRARVESERTAFLTRYPDVPAHWIHEKPYYKLRVGAFRTRLEARAFMDVIRQDYPGSYPAKDLAIAPREFLMQIEE